jgi:hypothetical protein
MLVVSETAVGERSTRVLGDLLPGAFGPEAPS